MEKVNTKDLMKLLNEGNEEKLANLLKSGIEVSKIIDELNKGFEESLTPEYQEKLAKFLTEQYQKIYQTTTFQDKKSALLERARRKQKGIDARYQYIKISGEYIVFNEPKEDSANSN